MEINSSIYREVMLMIKNYKPIQYRHELKHIINPLEAEILNRRLNLLFSKDHYTLNEGYYDVHSLYFDTPDEKIFSNSAERLGILPNDFRHITLPSDKNIAFITVMISLEHANILFDWRDKRIFTKKLLHSYQ